MKAGAIVCLLLAVGVLGYWAATGMHFATRTEIPPEPHLSCQAAADCGAGGVCTEGKCFDDFGDPMPGKEWRKAYELGLVDRAGPAAGGLVLLAGLLFFLDRRKRKAAG